MDQPAGPPAISTPVPASVDPSPTTSIAPATGSSSGMSPLSPAPSSEIAATTLTHAPGNVYLVPPSEMRRDDQWHHHLLLTSTPPNEIPVLCYGSTKPTEALKGAKAVMVEIAAEHHAIARRSAPRTIERPADAPADAPVDSRGRPTHAFWYPAILLSIFLRSLGSVDRRELDALAAVRSLSPDAIGAKSGTCREPVVRPGSWRGRTVELESRTAATLQTSLAALLTEHNYSSQERYEIAIPLYARPLRTEFRGIALDQEQDWALPVLEKIGASIPSARRRLVAGVGRVISVAGARLRTVQIARDTKLVVDVGTIERIETAPLAHLNSWRPRQARHSAPPALRRRSLAGVAKTP